MSPAQVTRDERDEKIIKQRLGPDWKEIGRIVAPPSRYREDAEVKIVVAYNESTVMLLVNPLGLSPESVLLTPADEVELIANFVAHLRRHTP